MATVVARDRSGTQPKKPLEKSQIIGGPGGSGPLDPSGRGAAKLESLPPHLRDRVTQAGNQGFPPEYAGVLEQFYRRLARAGDVSERPAADPAPKSESAPAGEKK